MRFIIPTQTLVRVSFAGLAVLGFTQQAAALPVYPGLIDSTLNVDCGTNSSRCLACHATAAGGRNTATRPFALTLQGFGFGRDSNPTVLIALLNASASMQDSAVAPASSDGPPVAGGGPPIPGSAAPGDAMTLAPMVTAGLATTDSDDDGLSDIAELLDCRNPSGEEYGVPEYGCDGGSFTGTFPRGNTGWAGVLLLALAGWIRTGRKASRPF